MSWSSLYDLRVVSSCLRRSFQSSSAIGINDTRMIAITTSEKFSRTIGTLPNAKPAPTQIPTHASPPRTL